MSTPTKPRTKPYPRAYLEFDSLPEDSLVDKTVVVLLLDRSPASLWRDLQVGAIPAPLPTSKGVPCRWHVGTLRRFIRERAGVAA